MKKIAISILFLSGLFQLTNAQSLMTDSAQYQAAIIAAKESYKTSIKENYLLYNGGEYGIKGHHVIGFPFFESPEMQNGSVYYMGDWYENLVLKYDITSEQLMIYDFSKTNLIALQTERIPQFRINGHEFFQLDSIASLQQKGYYERLCKGSSTLWVKRFKKMELSPKAEDQTAIFKEYDSYYLQKNGLFYPIGSRHAFENMFENYQSVIKKFVRQNNIDFKHHFEDALIKTVSFYNEIIH